MKRVAMVVSVLLMVSLAVLYGLRRADDDSAASVLGPATAIATVGLLLGALLRFAFARLLALDDRRLLHPAPFAIAATVAAFALLGRASREAKATGCKDTAPLDARTLVHNPGRDIPRAQLATFSERLARFDYTVDGVTVGDEAAVLTFSSRKERGREIDLLAGFSSNRATKPIRVGGRQGLIARSAEGSVATALVTECAAVIVFGVRDVEVREIAANALRLP